MIDRVSSRLLRPLLRIDYVCFFVCSFDQSDANRVILLMQFMQVTFELLKFKSGLKNCSFAQTNCASINFLDKNFVSLLFY